MDERWTLKLELRGPYGEVLAMTVPLAPDIAREVVRINKPDTALAAFGVGPTFSEVAEVLRRKEFRKDLFAREAERLGTILAERMEDAEGWHDASRIEPAKRQLRRG